MKRTRRLILLSFLVGALVVGSVPALAQDGTQPIAQFLQVSPVKQDFSIDKGATQVREVKITNRHVAPVRLRAQFDNILPEGDDGGTKGTQEPTPWDLKRYATIDTAEFTLGARETRTFPVTFRMPADVAPGGYYGQLRFIPTRRTDLPPVAVEGQIAELFLVRVPGPTKEAGTIKDFYVKNADGAKQGWFFFGNDLYFTTVIRNDGNVHFNAGPAVEAKDQFGVKRYENKPQPENVFPGGDRRFESRWEHAFVGLYKTQVTVNLPGQPGATKTITTLIVTPLAAAIAGGAVLLLVIYLLARRRRKRRAKKK